MNHPLMPAAIKAMTPEEFQDRQLKWFDMRYGAHPDEALVPCLVCGRVFIRRGVALGWGTRTCQEFGRLCEDTVYRFHASREAEEVLEELEEVRAELGSLQKEFAAYKKAVAASRRPG